MGKMNRKEAREQAFILVFEKSFRDEPVPEIIEAAKEGRELPGDAYMEQAAEGVFQHLEEIDETIKANLTGWKLERLSRVSLAVLRLSVFEMLHREDIPVSVSINEAVELAKRFATKDDAAYVNGVLGSVARSLPAERLTAEGREGE
ncbi:MAG TPA: transcription antitermination factor NusB [Firmicutes bacterium]|nr:transcription antitermination factor NusB [Bacillota bacterium]